jgi:hypothetical protein
MNVSLRIVDLNSLKVILDGKLRLIQIVEGISDADQCGQLLCVEFQGFGMVLD